MNYYICYAVAMPSSDGSTNWVSERILYLSPKKTPTDKVAIERAIQFREQDTLLCEALGRTFIMGDLIACEKGKVRIIPLI